MIVTRESLLERFQLLNDEELLGLFQSGDLIDFAKVVAAEELGRRGVEVAMPAIEANTASEKASGGEDNAPSGGGDLVVIARLFTPAEAQMLQSRLHADGVPAVVTDAHIVGTNSHGGRRRTRPRPGIRVRARTRDHKRHRAGRLPLGRTERIAAAVAIQVLRWVHS